MRAVCYARVSSTKQRDTDTIAAQLRMLPEHVTRQGWQLVADVSAYVDDRAISAFREIKRIAKLAAANKAWLTYG